MRTLIVALVALLAWHTSPVSTQRATAAATQTLPARIDEYARYDLQAPERGAVKVSYDVSLTTAGARTLVDPIPQGSVASGVAATDLMTGAPLQFAVTPAAITVTLARSVPVNGQGRVRIDKTVTDAKRYVRDGETFVFTQPLTVRRASVVLPPGFALTSCNVPSQVLSDDSGRVAVSFMHQAPGTATLIVKARRAAAVGPAAAPRPLTNARSWEPPPAQGATERARLTERARQDRDIVYFLQQPSTERVPPVSRLHRVAAEARARTSTWFAPAAGYRTRRPTFSTPAKR